MTGSRPLTGPFRRWGGRGQNRACEDRWFDVRWCGVGGQHFTDQLCCLFDLPGPGRRHGSGSQPQKIPVGSRVISARRSSTLDDGGSRS